MNHNNLKTFKKLNLENIDEFKGNNNRGKSVGSFSVIRNTINNKTQNKFNFTTNTFYKPNSEVKNKNKIRLN
jgi:hypothetical protein